MSRPLLLDLFCGAGGAAMGYHRAGFDVVGVDISPQPNYPFRFVQGDWAVGLDIALHAGRYIYDSHGDTYGPIVAVHASPPCQAFSLATGYHPDARAEHPDLVDPVRDALDASGLPYVIENVPGAPVRPDLVLCGEMFRLRVHRHRLFECGNGFFPMRLKHQRHQLKGADHNCHIADGHTRIVAGNYANHADASDAMGIDWMTRKGLAQAIPPAYTEYIGHQLLAHINSKAAA